MSILVPRRLAGVIADAGPIATQFLETAVLMGQLRIGRNRLKTCSTTTTTTVGVASIRLGCGRGRRSWPRR